MMFSPFQVQYYTPVPQDCFLQNFTAQYMKVVMSNKELEEKNTQLNKKVEILQTEAQLHKKEIKDLRKLANKKEKRKYSKRRIGLQKKYVCRFKDCQSKYSSQVALNSHIKRKHEQCETSHE